MITSFTLPKTEQALTQLKKDIVDYYRQHQQDAHAIVDTNEPDEQKLLKLLGDILTRDQLVTIIAEETEDIKEQETVYQDTHPTFSPLKAAIDLATKYMYETKPEETSVTISMMEKDGKIEPQIGIIEHAVNWYRFTDNDIDYYINRVDYYEDYLAFLEELQITLKKQSLTEDDKELITTYLVERRDFWMDQEELAAEKGNDRGQQQLNKALFQAFINKVVDFPSEEIEEDTD
jgi:hypothetical protein